MCYCRPSIRTPFCERCPSVMQAEIARLNHQHANDEAANQMLSETCARLQEEIARLKDVLDRMQEIYTR